MIYTLTLNNGRILSGLRAAGDCYVSKTEIREDMFTGGLRHVVVTGTPDSAEEAGLGGSGTLTGAALGGIFTVDGEWYFWLVVPSEEELGRMQDRADIEYIAMMTEVEL